VGPGTSVLRSGNDRSRQASLHELEQASRDDLAVWEVSNRHLRDRAVAGDVAVLTNITPNHIEDHGSWDAYVAAKSRLVLAPGAGGHAVLSAIDPHSRQITDQVRGTGATIWLFGAPPQQGSRDGHCWLSDGLALLRLPGDDTCLEIGPVSRLPLLGAHNLLNLQAALCAVAACGFADPTTLSTAIATAAGLPGRLELVAEEGGVRWVYDIQATTAPAAAAGIAAIADGRPSIILLVGGEDKGMDFSDMAEAAAGSCCRVIALPGTGSEAFLAALDGRVEAEHYNDLDDALRRAQSVARPGDTVLLSPGCAFFFREYIEGGVSFAVRVRQMLDRASHGAPSHQETT
jgi:UDP-N-acetylmuramoylalanine--D-glutamate ligase